MFDAFDCRATGYLAHCHSWRESPDPEFVPKAATIVGLYLDPPDPAIAPSFSQVDAPLDHG